MVLSSPLNSPQGPWRSFLQMAQKCLPSRGASLQIHLSPAEHWGIARLYLTFWGEIRRYKCSWHEQDSRPEKRQGLIQSCPCHEHPLSWTADVPAVHVNRGRSSSRPGWRRIKRLVWPLSGLNGTNRTCSAPDKTGWGLRSLHHLLLRRYCTSLERQSTLSSRGTRERGGSGTPLSLELGTQRRR